jgi:uncharacterized integral membrane protein
MRLLSSILGDVIVAIAAVLLTLFALENSQLVSLNFLGARFAGNIWWLILGAAAIGFVLALLLALPGRVATGRRAYSLSRLNAKHQQNLAELRDAHAQLQAERERTGAEHDRLTADHNRLNEEFQRQREELVATRSERDQARQDRDELRAARDQAIAQHDQLRDEHTQTLAERDGLRERLSAMPAAVPVAAAGLAGAAGAAGVAGVAAARHDHDEVVAHEPTEEPEAPEAAPEAQPAADTVVAREPVVTQPARLSFGERLRAAITGRPVEQVQAEEQARVAGATVEPEADHAEAREVTAAETATGEVPAAEPVPEEPARGEVSSAEALNAAPANEVVAAEGPPPSSGERVQALFTGQPVEAVHAEDMRDEEMRGEDVRGAEERAADIEPAMTAATPAEARFEGEQDVDHAAAPIDTMGAPEPATPMAAATAPYVHIPEAAAAEPATPVAPETAEPAMPTEAAPAEATPAEAAAPDEATPGRPAEPSVGDRVRSLFHGPETAERTTETQP